MTRINICIRVILCKIRLFDVSKSRIIASSAFRSRHFHQVMPDTHDLYGLEPRLQPLDILAIAALCLGRVGPAIVVEKCLEVLPTAPVADDHRVNFGRPKRNGPIEAAGRQKTSEKERLGGQSRTKRTQKSVYYPDENTLASIYANTAVEAVSIGASDRRWPSPFWLGATLSQWTL